MIILMHHRFMRTTINLDDDVMRQSVRRAKLLGISVGKAVSDLARRGLQLAPPTMELNGLTVFDPPIRAGKINENQVKIALSDFP